MTLANIPGRAILVSAALTGLLSSCGGPNAGGGRFSMPPMPVEVSPVAVRPVADKFEAVGTIEAIEAITVVGEIDAVVKSLPFNEGGFIRRGGLIAQLDDAQLAAEMARAEALRAQTKATYDRVRTIVEQGAGAPQDLDDAAAALKVADANLAVARARFEKTRVLAPFDGIIGARRISVGTFLRTGQAITELANIDEIRVTFSAPERFIARLSQGAPVTVSTTAFSGPPQKGRIIVIEPIIDQLTRSARVVARVQNVGRKFRPGMSANISAVLSERPNALTIPSEAVFGSGNQSFVFIVKPDSTVARVALTLGTRLPDVVEVIDGLQPGMTVVRAGHQKLFDGGKVMPISSQAAGAAGTASGG
ncbi:MAG: efflux RND transporter periplasmic adaptor subunit [Bacteroidota bacterium]